MEFQIVRVVTKPKHRAAGCVFYCKKTGRLLLAQRSGQVPFPHKWDQWGGSLEGNESPFAGALRESQEESGYSKSMDFILANIWESPVLKYYVYVSLVEEEFTPLLNFENENYLWCLPDDLPKKLNLPLKESIPGIIKVLGIL